jgi:transcriptional regulator with XRE-family HTH domain
MPAPEEGTMSGEYDDERPIRPDGLAIRRLRRNRGWSRRDLLEAIAEAARRETGIRETISPNLLEGVEEGNEAIPYSTLCRIASGLDCEPVELLEEAR